AGALSQVQTEISGLVVRKASVSLTLTCQISDTYPSPTAATLGSCHWKCSHHQLQTQPAGGGLNPAFSQNRFTLQIEAAKQEDEAVYFCGARLTLEWLSLFIGVSISSVWTDKLVFGSGTDLTVEPNNQKSSNPEVIVMKSKKQKDGKIGKAACLARNFYTKDISLEMSPDKVVYEPSTSILTSEGFYDTIKVVDVAEDQEVTCRAKFDDKTITDNSTLSGTILWYSCHLVLEAVSSSTCYSVDTKMEKANMLSMAVLGLRVLLAKSIAFNTLMSIKLFLF
uniref:Immunoglobulin domain-containing protein n=1 Tax=Calidris pygmaea TaxID=425635 RepID=A0A8C3K2V5_9CHAR